MVICVTCSCHQFQLNQLSLPFQGVQGRMVLVVIFFIFLNLTFMALNLVHDVEAIHRLY